MQQTRVVTVINAYLTPIVALFASAFFASTDGASLASKTKCAVWIKSVLLY
jgi:hypothetical protein